MTLVVIAMSSKAWGVVGAISCFGAYQLLKYAFGKTAGYVFAGLLIVAYLAVNLIYRRREARLQEQLSELSPEDQRRAIQEIDPEIREDIKKNEEND